VPGDLRSYGGGNGLPRGVKQSPDFSRIIEEDEEQEEQVVEEEKQNDVSMILVKSRIFLNIHSGVFFFTLASTNFNTIDYSNIKE
jgi:hypothetical protein